MPDINNPPGESLSEQQLDDLDVDRQRERLERSRPQDGKQQSGQQGGAGQSGDRSRQQAER